MKLNSNNPAAAAMAVIGVLLMLVAVVFQLIIKPPDPVKAVAAIKKDESQEVKEIDNFNKETDAEVAEIQTRLWTISDDQIAPEALNRVGDVAKKHNVKLTTFRPQKEVSAGALSLLPFFVSVEGSFPAVFDFLKDIEGDASLLLVVNSVQLTSNDQTTHNVTAAIGLDAYIDPNRDKVVNASPGSSSTTGTTTTTKTSQTDASHKTSKPATSGKA
jgi:Tfp pilus assembly protein PilO